MAAELQTGAAGEKTTNWALSISLRWLKRNRPPLVKDGITVSMARDLIIEKAIDVPCPVEWR
jgi:hypothetical protein